jgi:hypothetical protein
MPARYPYIVSDRDFSAPSGTDPYPDVGTELSFWLPVPPYDQSKRIKQNGYGTWLTALLNDITDGRVMIFIHGFANPWTKVIDTSDATHGLAAMVGHFWSYPGLTIPLVGPIVFFDWPSTGKLLPNPYHEAQGKAVKTATQFFKNPAGNIDLKRIIDDIAKAKPGTRINIVCHSMGNYVFANGASSLTPGSVSLALMNAAAIDIQSFNPQSGSQTLADGIQKCLGSNYAMIMSTTYDDVLPTVSEKPLVGDPWAELGLWNIALGTPVYPCTRPKVVSDLVNQKHGAESIHTAYYYIPLVLDLMNTYLNLEFAEADKSAIANSPQVKRIDEPARV